MIRSSATRRVVGKLVTIASVFVALGCTPPEIEQKVEPLPQVMVYPAEAWDTPLPPGVDSDPKTFQDRVARQERITGQLHTRVRAAICPMCTTGDCARCTVKVTIQAIANTQRIAPETPPRPGQAVAHIENLDATKTEAYFGFRPRSQADYYFWVDKRPDADSARITVLEVPRMRGVVRAGRQKNLYYCHWHAPGEGRPDADFLEYKGPCTVGPLAATPKVSEAAVFPAGPIFRMLDRFAATLQAAALASQGGWIDCNSGCCT